MFITQFTGNLGNDCKVTSTEKGNMTTFEVAVNEKTKNAENGTAETTYWVKCAMFRKSDFLSEHLKKGVKVMVSGEFAAKIYNGQRGAMLDLSCIVNCIEILTFPKKD